MLLCDFVLLLALESKTVAMAGGVAGVSIEVIAITAWTDTTCTTASYVGVCTAFMGIELVCNLGDYNLA